MQLRCLWDADLRRDSYDPTRVRRAVHQLGHGARLYASPRLRPEHGTVPQRRSTQGGQRRTLQLRRGQPAQLQRPDSGLLFGIELPSPEEAAEAVAGWGDKLTLGATKWAREELGDENVNTCSAAYQTGGYAGLATAALIPGEDETVGADEGVRTTVSDTTEPHVEAAVLKQSYESSEEGQTEPAPEEKCSGGAGSNSALSVISGSGRFEYLSAQGCPRQKSYPRGRKWHVKAIRGTSGGWREFGDATCGIVGGAALVPGVDVFDAPIEVACAGYGTFTAVEIIVNHL